MNKFTLLPFLLFIFINTKAQDKIINTKNDTIHCKILSISSERILYELKNSDGSVTGKFIPFSLVAEYSQAQPVEKRSKMPKQESQKAKIIIENPLSLGLNFGRSNIPGYFDNVESSSALPNYYSKLKKGFHINVNAHYMISAFWGLGVEYSYLKTSTSGSIQSESTSPSVFLMDFEKYRQYINYLGASVFFQQHVDAKRKLILRESLSAGVLFLHLEYQITSPVVNQSGYNVIANNMLLTGDSFSGKLGFSIEYRLFKTASLGLSSDFIWCKLKRASFESKGSNNYSYSSNDQKLSNAMKLSRIDYSFVLRYYL